MRTFLQSTFSTTSLKQLVTLRALTLNWLLTTSTSFVDPTTTDLDSNKALVRVCFNGAFITKIPRPPSQIRPCSQLVYQIQKCKWDFNEFLYDAMSVKYPENLNQGLTHFFFVTFASEKDRDDYIVHPDHKVFVALVGPHVDKVTVLDYWVKK